MSGQYEANLTALGLKLPAVVPPVANYVPTAASGKLLFVAGQLPVVDGKVSSLGRLGDKVATDEGVTAARQCALNILAQVKAAIGDLDRVKRIVNLRGYVACTPEFTEQPKVIDGASDLMVAVFGDAGRHSRAAVGVAALPRGASVEVEAVLELKD